MPTFSLRCRNSKCRHRRVSAIHPDEYKRVPKCPICHSDAGWRIEQRQYAKLNRCYCSGYHHPHHKGTSKFCEHHPQGFYNQAKRAGIKDEDIPLEYLGRPIREEEPCPF